MSLAQVVVVGSLQLVVDDDRPPGIVLSNEVNAERACCAFALDVRKRDVENVVQNVDVLLEPGGQVVRLVPPHIPQRNTFDSRC